ncbi:hypothetical protein DR950_20190 [Kitasatospora xanthocidica]|uniref:Uncharacterized protein n=1 Tax=Kitasatospora xanthocidica TaxID=83382 RepID=A0A372ZWH0_9ACTN|nr:hypothetical protein [Kitasatospora xanthocidica]RGD59792.1 hypothetical protein DR950_20190 [Kitasatospora xanthocidica]
MSATPRHRSEQADREELARLLPAPAAPVLPRSRHLLLKEHLLDSITDPDGTPDTPRRTTPRRTTRRRGLLLGAALPLGLAAALTGVLLTTGTDGSTPGDDDSGRSLGSSSGVAYTLESEEEVVRLTILEDYKPVDVDQLQRDIDRFGIRARVYPGEPGCKAREPKQPSHVDLTAGWDIEHGPGEPLVLTVHPRRLPAGTEIFIYLPLARTSPANSSREMQAGLMKSPGPSCMPAKEYVNPLASLYPTPPAK